MTKLSERPLFTFVFEGRKGAVYSGDFIMWGGMGFEISAAGPAMREVIDTARAKLRKPN
jgi:hypothetical protein